MSRYLVVAHKTAQSPELQAALQEIAGADGQAAFVLLVPSTSAGLSLVQEEERGALAARQAADEAHARLRAAGLSVERTLIGPPDPVKAVTLELRRPGADYAGIVISTLPEGISRWLGLDAPGRMRRRFGLPVTHVPCKTDAAVPGAVESEPLGRQPAQRWDLSSLSAYRGREIVSSDGHRLGSLTKIVYDYVDQEPVWLGVGSGLHTYLAPASAASGEQEHLRLCFSRATITREPPVDIGEGFDSLTAEHGLYDYFGIPFNELRDVRVLHAGEALPGLLRVTG
jgi:hypothetical protein